MKPRKVLIVDDDPSIRSLLTQVVQQSGYAAEGAEDCQAALNRLTDGGFDAVFTDIRIPPPTGIDFLRKLQEFHANLPVMVLTGFPSMELGVTALREGATDFIPNTFHPRDIRLLHERRINPPPAARRHERWDGTGYPDGLRSMKIPILARVTAVAAAHEALTRVSPYGGEPCPQGSSG